MTKQIQMTPETFEGLVLKINQLQVHEEKLERELILYQNALWKACGDDEQCVKDTLDSQRMQLDDEEMAPSNEAWMLTEVHQK